MTASIHSRLKEAVKREFRNMLSADERSWDKAIAGIMRNANIKEGDMADARLEIKSSTIPHEKKAGEFKPYLVLVNSGNNEPLMVSEIYEDERNYEPLVNFMAELGIPTRDRRGEGPPKLPQDGS